MISIYPLNNHCVSILVFFGCKIRNSYKHVEIYVKMTRHNATKNPVFIKRSFGGFAYLKDYYKSYKKSHVGTLATRAFKIFETKF